VLDLLKVVVVGAAILLISVLVYMYYEDPARKFLRRLVSSKKP
jgi:peptidoglycan/LPS O-acetylase OafA/YrhL